MNDPYSSPQMHNERQLVPVRLDDETIIYIETTPLTDRVLDGPYISHLV